MSLPKTSVIQAIQVYIETCEEKRPFYMSTQPNQQEGVIHIRTKRKKLASFRCRKADTISAIQHFQENAQFILINDLPK